MKLRMQSTNRMPIHLYREILLFFCFFRSFETRTEFINYFCLLGEPLATVSLRTGLGKIVALSTVS